MALDALGPYRIDGTIGTGGMGVVYRAYHDALRRTVALKVLSAAPTREDVYRFEREMKLAASLNHPNVVKIWDGGCIDQTPYIAMELLVGQSLDTVTGEAIGWQRVLQICAKIARGLAYLHERGITHRDIKPSNIFLLEDGTPKLIDFGLAATVDSTRFTRPGRMVGTPLFMAPELFTGKAANPVSDLWSLGCVLYFLLTGRTHIVPADPENWLNSLLLEPIRPPSTIRSDIPQPVSNLTMRLLDRDPRQRLGSARELCRDLERLVDDGLRVTQPVRSAPTRRKAYLPLILTLFLFATLCVIGFLTRHKPVPVAPVHVPERAVTRPAAFAAWREVERSLAVLGKGGPTARAEMARLQKKCAVNPGEVPGTWICWVRLGRWLEGPPADPPVISQLRTDSTPLDEYLVGEGIGKALRAPPPEQPARLLSLALRGLEMGPRDGRVWFLLGEALYMDGLTAEAGRAWTVALKCIGSLSLEGWRRPTYRGCVRALLLSGRDDAADLCARFFALSEGRQEAWEAFGEVATDPRFTPGALRLAGILQGRLDTDADASLVLGIPQLQSPDAVDVGAIWKEAFRRHPKHAGLAASLANYYLDTGQIDEAVLCTGLANLGFGFESLVGYVQGPPRDRPRYLRGNDPAVRTPTFLPSEVTRLLEIDQVDEARQLFERVVSPAEAVVAPYGALSLALVAAGRGNNVREEALLKQLVNDPPDASETAADLWYEAAETLVTPPGRPLMEKALLGLEATSSYRTPAGRGAADAFRALWLSRQGRLAEALTCLASSLNPARYGTRAYMSAILEVESLPLWEEFMGNPPPAVVRERARAVPAPAHPAFARYMGALRNLNRESATALARLEQYRAYPNGDSDRVLWLLSEAYNAVAAGDAGTLAKTLARVRYHARHRTQRLWLFSECARLERLAPRAPAVHR
jgi:tetratricopeptide (TPR) repeat protein